MPTTPCRARHLIQSGEATAEKRKPFTIRMKIDTTENVQPITLGADAGHEKIGLSASTEKKELYSAVVTVRTDIRIQDNIFLHDVFSFPETYPSVRFSQSIRNSDGEIFSYLRNTLASWEALLYPTCSAICSIVKFVSRSICLAVRSLSL